MLCSDIGPLDAKIMLVGEAPGATEEQQGIPFCGSSGTLLKSMLAHSGIDFNKCYVTNVMPVRPPGNNFKHFYDGKFPSAELEHGWQVLRDKIERMKPDVCILLGAEPLKAVTNLKGISDWRGYFLSYKGTNLLATYHPSAVMRDFSLHPIFELDVTKATQRKPKEFPHVQTAPALGQAVEFLHKAKTAEMIAYDIETVGRRVRSIALAFRENGSIQCMSIPFMRFGSSANAKVNGSIITFDSQGPSFSSYWSKKTEILLIKLLAQLFADPSIKYVGQNSILFDEPFLWREFRFHVANQYLDLMHVFHLLYAEFPKSLNFICSILTDYPNYWAQKNTSIDIEEWVYNGRDAIVTLESCEKVEESAKTMHQERFYREHIHPLCFTIERLNRRGALIDQAKIAEHKQTAEKLLAESEKQICEIAGYAVNINSPKQIAKLLYEEQGFPKIYSKTSHSITTDEEALRKLNNTFPNRPVLQSIISFRKASKLLSNYLNIKLHPDGRMRTSYNPSGTKTGRLSSSSNIFGEGQNLQNIPAGKGQDIVNLRDIFIAPPGKLLLKGDLKQAESMVVAWILHRLGYPMLHDLYKQKTFDIHRWAAAFALSKPEQSVTKNERNVFKIVNHSGNYMSGPNVMVKTALKHGIELSAAYSKVLLEKKRRQMPELEKWWSWVDQQIKTTRCLTSCFGRMRYFFGRLDDSTLRSAVAWEPQSTVGDLCNKILMRLDEPKALPEECFPILQVHDEIVLEVLEEKLDECINAYRKAAQISLNISTDPLIIPVELSYGKNWKDMKEIEA